MFEIIKRNFVSKATIGTIQKLLSEKIESKFGKEIYKEIVNTSWKHAVPKGSETHFEVLIVSQEFENKSILARNRMMNELLKDEIKKIHSISFKLLTSSQWENYDRLLNKNPPCIKKQ